MDKRVVEFLRTKLQAGKDIKEIRSILEKNAYTPEDIEKVMTELTRVEEAKTDVPEEDEYRHDGTRHKVGSFSLLDSLIFSVDHFLVMQHIGGFWGMLRLLILSMPY